MKQEILRRAARQQLSGIIARTLNEALSIGQQTAFLCHSHKDQTLALGLRNLLLENGWNRYIDWLDQELPPQPDRNTALRIKEKISSLRWFHFLATANSTNSRWFPWEIGCADSAKDSRTILLIKTQDDNNQWYGNEYLQLYRRIATAEDPTTKKTGYAVFDPKQETGIWLENLK